MKSVMFKISACVGNLYGTGHEAGNVNVMEITFKTIKRLILRNVQI